MRFWRALGSACVASLPLGHSPHAIRLRSMSFWSILQKIAQKKAEISRVAKNAKLAAETDLAFDENMKFKGRVDAPFKMIFASGGKLKMDNMSVDARLLHGDEVLCSGVNQVSGFIRCRSFGTTESSDVQAGGIQAEDVDIKGSANVKFGVRANSVTVDGSFTVGADIKCQTLSLKGTLRTSGIIRGDQIVIRMTEGVTSADTIFGSQSVTISSLADKPSANFLDEIKLGRLPVKTKCKVDRIVGQTLDLSGVDALLVKGRDVKVGKDSFILTLEYSGTLEVDETAQVRNTVHIPFLRLELPSEEEDADGL